MAKGKNKSPKPSSGLGNLGHILPAYTFQQGEASAMKPKGNIAAIDVNHLEGLLNRPGNQVYSNPYEAMAQHIYTLRHSFPEADSYRYDHKTKSWIFTDSKGKAIPKYTFKWEPPPENA